MRQLFMLLIGALLVANTGFAQDKEAKKAYGKAKSSLNNYNLDQTKNDKLADAYANIQLAVNDDVLASEAATWITAGDIYAALGSKIIQSLDPNLSQFTKSEGLPSVDNPGVMAFEAYDKALEIAEKKGDIKKAVTGLIALQNPLINFGATYYQAAEPNYEWAYENWNACLEAHKVIEANGEVSTLSERENGVGQQTFYTTLAALQAGKKTEGRALIQSLIDMDYNDPLIYELMYSLIAEDGNDEEAYEYLVMGRERYPDTTSLLFVEINHFLRQEKLDVLITKLEQGIAAEPDNASLYATMGSVYDQLYQTSVQEGKEEEGQQYFDGALDYYNQALEKDGSNVTAIYSVGALYYNKAALMTQELSALEDDYSKEGTAKYKELQTKVFEEFDKALPFFKKAESIDPNDRNTLIALKEIYAKKDDITMSNEFKTRLETVESGGSNPSSYFNE